jgi:hypothetical protein
MNLVTRPRLLLRVLGAVLTGTLALMVLMAPAATAQSTGDGYVRLAHLSPNTPAVDVYLYSFGDSTAQLVLDHVSYGTVSPFEQVAAGEYTVAMRPAGALRLEVFDDPLTTPSGAALVQVIQASLLQDTVTVTAGSQTLTSGLQFGDATGFIAVPAGTWTVQAAGPSETASQQETLAAGSVYTLVVLDEPGQLGIDDLLDAEGSAVAPASGVQAGLGGAAARPGAPLQPWVVAGVTGFLLAGVGALLVSRRRRPARHAR